MNLMCKGGALELTALRKPRRGRAVCNSKCRCSLLHQSSSSQYHTLCTIIGMQPRLSVKTGCSYLTATLHSALFVALLLATTPRLLWNTPCTGAAHTHGKQTFVGAGVAKRATRCQCPDRKEPLLQQGRWAAYFCPAGDAGCLSAICAW